MRVPLKTGLQPVALREEFEREGVWLFRWRSYLPLLLLGLVLLGLRHFGYPEGSHRLDYLWEFACLALSLVGVAIRVATVGCAPKGTSGRNTKSQVADSLNTTGLYSIVRHPLYLGNFMIWFGLSLLPRLWWFSLLYLLIFWLYYERIMFAEEEFLRRKFEQEHLAWAQRVPAFVPNLKAWRPPDLPFSIRWALKREYAGLFAVISAFFAMEMIEDFSVTGHLVFDRVWGMIFLVSAVAYTLLRIVIKGTRLFDAPGR